MSSIKRFIAKTTAAVMTASMLLSANVMAETEPMEELSEILEAQMENQTDSLLEQTIGFEAIEEAQEANGSQIELNVSLTENTVKDMGLEEFMPDGGIMQFNLQNDPNLKKWLLGASFGLSEDESLLDIGLYGDEEVLALTFPQFYAGALSLHSGSLKTQYENSVWKEIIGENIPEFPDIKMHFYPEDIEKAENNKYEKLAEDLAAEAVTEKEIDGDYTVYTTSVKTAQIMGFYKEILDEVLNQYESMGMPASSIEEMDTNISQMTDEMEGILGEEVQVKFYAKDNLVEKIAYAIEIDNSELYAVQQLQESLGTAENETEHILEADGLMQGTLEYEIIFIDPKNPSCGMEFLCTVADSNSSDKVDVKGCYRTESDGTTEVTSFDLEVAENGETVYSATPFTMTFNAETGDFNIDVVIEAEGEKVGMEFDSTFAEIEKGKSYTLVIDKASITDGEQEIGVVANIAVKSEPGEINAPQEQRELLTMTQGNIVDFVNEISANAQTWASQFVPQTQEATSESVAG